MNIRICGVNTSTGLQSGRPGVGIAASQVRELPGFDGWEEIVGGRAADAITGWRSMLPKLTAGELPDFGKCHVPQKKQNGKAQRHQEQGQIGGLI